MLSCIYFHLSIDLFTQNRYSDYLKKLFLVFSISWHYGLSFYLEENIIESYEDIHDWVCVYIPVLVVNLLLW